MNLQEFTGSKQPEFLFANFNQDASCISVGTQTGFSLYTSDPLQPRFDSTFGGIGIVEMLFRTSLVVVVGCGNTPTASPRKLTIFNTATQQAICERLFPTSILNVKLNNKRVVVVLENKIHVFALDSMSLLHIIDTPHNPMGICALSPSDDSLLAYPAAPGEIQLFDALKLLTITTGEHPHKGITISNLAFNYSGDLLAAASESGTLIRIFAVSEKSCHPAYDFRRGINAAQVIHMNFSFDSTYLTVTSTSATIHIFKLVPEQRLPLEENKGFFSYWMPYASAAASAVYGDYRACAYVRGEPNCVSICAITKHNVVTTVNAQGIVATYEMAETFGADCTLKATFSLFGSNEGESDSAVFDEEPESDHSNSNSLTPNHTTTTTTTTSHKYDYNSNNNSGDGDGDFADADGDYIDYGLLDAPHHHHH
eukprot:TRINITY_DN3241_c0_g1_i1.p1 TRINITY_DN3241_c0_g1~~TRINITY_DN3241_c0_g1_i1.p1  ORF type:complete len:425 (+),score=77.02 TRINITY_DN3241_c0_g1_i1:39-1313(+)